MKYRIDILVTDNSENPEEITSTGLHLILSSILKLKLEKKQVHRYGFRNIFIHCTDFFMSIRLLFNLQNNHFNCNFRSNALDTMYIQITICIF